MNPSPPPPANADNEAILARLFSAPIHIHDGTLEGDNKILTRLAGHLSGMAAA